MAARNAEITVKTTLAPILAVLAVLLFAGAATAQQQCVEGYADSSCGGTLSWTESSGGGGKQLVPVYVGKCNDSCTGNGSKGTTCNLWYVYTWQDVGGYFRTYQGNNKDRYNTLCGHYGW